MIVVFANEKGGVGKTTSSMNFAFESARRGHKTLLIDTDTLQSIIRWRHYRPNDLDKNINIISYVSSKLHKDILNYKDDYKYIVIDTAPTHSEVTRSAIYGSDLLIIPCMPSMFDSRAAMNTISLYKEAKVYKENLKCAFLINGKKLRTKIYSKLINELKTISPDTPILVTEISEKVIYAETSLGYTIHEIDYKGSAKQEVSNLFDEITKEYSYA